MSADRCDVCGELWQFVSDAPCGIGLVRAVHPPNRCVPKVQAHGYLPPCANCGERYDPGSTKRVTCSVECSRAWRLEQQRDAARKRDERKKRGRRVSSSCRCLSCGGTFKPDPAMPRKTCSPKCWEARRAQMQAQAYQRRKERAA